MEKVCYNQDHLQDTGKLIARLSTAGLMLFHGVHKLIFGHGFIRHLLKLHGLPDWLFYGVPIGEVLCPVLIIAGIWCRGSALLVAFTMAMSIFLFYGQQAFVLDEHGGLNSQLNLLFLFSSLAISFLGPGKYRFRKWTKTLNC
jgi:putative oxidoreductase